MNIIFRDNVAVNGAGLTCFASSPTVISCTFCNNTAEITGGAIRCSDDSFPLFQNCTVVENNCPQVGAGVFCETYASPIFQNCIVAFNGEAESFYCITQGEATLTCCDVFGNVGGDWVGCIENQIWINGNIWEDPMLCDAAAGNFRLQVESPCAPFSPPNPECDLIGAWPTICDPTAVDDVDISPLAVQLGLSFPNPFGNSTRVTYVIPDGGEPQTVRLQVFDASGRHLRTLARGPQPPGIHHVIWDGKNSAGAKLANGLYFYRLTWDGGSQTRSVMLLD